MMIVKKALGNVLWVLTFMVGVSSFSTGDAAEPTGEWRVANGKALVRIDDCSGALWGIISWEKDPGHVDAHNPIPGERGRPTLGLHIIRNMVPKKPGVWQGIIYNAENGKTYNSQITLSSADVLRVEGCVLGILCGGENWTRVKAAPVQTSEQDRRSKLSACEGIQ